ncbi:hypothetical protein T439DRAFT_380424 [Meredithblackwellia eburnea MCA 4105]
MAADKEAKTLFVQLARLSDVSPGKLREMQKESQFTPSSVPYDIIAPLFFTKKLKRDKETIVNLNPSKHGSDIYFKNDPLFLNFPVPDTLWTSMVDHFRTTAFSGEPETERDLDSFWGTTVSKIIAFFFPCFIHLRRESPLSSTFDLGSRRVELLLASALRGLRLGAIEVKKQIPRGKISEVIAQLLAYSELIAAENATQGVSLKEGYYAVAASDYLQIFSISYGRGIQSVFKYSGNLFPAPEEDANGFDGHRHIVVALCSMVLRMACSAVEAMSLRSNDLAKAGDQSLTSSAGILPTNILKPVISGQSTSIWELKARVEHYKEKSKESEEKSKESEEKAKESEEAAVAANQHIDELWLYIDKIRKRNQKLRAGEVPQSSSPLAPDRISATDRVQIPPAGQDEDQDPPPSPSSLASPPSSQPPEHNTKSRRSPRPSAEMFDQAHQKLQEALDKGEDADGNEESTRRVLQLVRDGVALLPKSCRNGGYVPDQLERTGDLAEEDGDHEEAEDIDNNVYPLSKKRKYAEH